MCVSRIRSPEKKIRHHLPRASTRSTVRSVTGLWSSTLASFASVVSNPVTIRPPSTRFSARAVRKMLSPSGIVVRLSNSSRQREKTAPHVETERRGLESGVEQKPRQRMLRHRHAIHARDQHRRAPAPFRIVRALHIGGEELCECARYLRTCRFILGEEHLDVWIAATNIRSERTINQNNACTHTPGQRRTLFRCRWPSQQCTIRVRRVRGRKHYHFMLFFKRCPQRAQQIHCTRKCKLCRTQVGRKVPA